VTLCGRTWTESEKATAERQAFDPGLALRRRRKPTAEIVVVDHQGTAGHPVPGGVYVNSATGTTRRTRQGSPSKEPTRPALVAERPSAASRARPAARVVRPRRAVVLDRHGEGLATLSRQGGRRYRSHSRGGRRCAAPRCGPAGRPSRSAGHLDPSATVARARGGLGTEDSRSVSRGKELVTEARGVSQKVGKGEAKVARTSPALLRRRAPAS